MTLLNNWEAPYFDFDEPKLVKLMDDAVELGVDMFLLDDGWFANKYPRSGDQMCIRDRVEPGDFEIQIGAASDDIRFKKTITIN